MNGGSELELNEKKLKKIEYEILKLENENAKTKNYGKRDMVERIKRLIKDGVDEKLTQR